MFSLIYPRGETTIRQIMNENFVCATNRLDEVQKAIFEPQQPLAIGRPVIFKGTKGMVGSEYLGMPAGNMIEEKIR